MANAMGKCAGTNGCGAVTTVPDVWNLWKTDPNADEMWQRYRRIVCQNCGRKISAQTVTGKVSKRACGSWCTEGTGLKCTCECGGTNHGSAYAPGTLFYLH